MSVHGADLRRPVRWPGGAVVARLALAALLAVAAAPSSAQAPREAPVLSVPGAAPQAAATGPRRVDAVVAELVADVGRAAPGQPFRIGLRLSHDPHWHTYWRNPGDSGLPTRFEPTGPAGTEYGDIVWPAPRRLAIGDLANYGYEGEVVLARPVTLPASFAGASARFEVRAQWLVCRDVCIPGEAALALEVPVAAASAPAAPGLVALFEASRARAPAPGQVLEAGWWRDGERALLRLPAGMQARRAEFFPYFEGVVVPAAAQALHAAAGGDATRGDLLALRTAPPAAAAGAAAALPVPAGGLLLVDDKPIEVALAPLAQAPASGDLVALAEVAPAAPPASQGLLGRLGGGQAAGQSVPAGGAGSGAGAWAGAAAAGGAAPGGGFLLALAGALLGGAILNLMPCVFPVIGLKILSFAQAAGGDARRARRHAASFATGIVLSFVALAAVFLALRAAGTAVGWGFQMQSPVFVGAMALLFVLIALNLFGVFETGLVLTRLGGLDRGGRVDASGGEAGRTGPGSLGGSFWSGVLAVLVATPCTAPFMGGAVGFTLTTTAAQTVAVFGALGIGMAAPYLLLGWLPRLLRWLPRPGPWLGAFRQLLAFPMLATAAWLAWVLALQAGADGVLHLLMAAVFLGFAAWAYGRTQRATPRRRQAAALAGMIAGIVAVAATAWQLARIGSLAAAPVTAAAVSPQADVAGRGEPAGARAQGQQWQPWSAAGVSAALAQGRPVLVDFTAAWCITCQANKRLVLDREVVLRAFEAQQVVLLRADWTRGDPAISAELARFGRNGVPFYLLYASAQEPPRILPELLTVDTVLAALGAMR